MPSRVRVLGRALKHNLDLFFCSVSEFESKLGHLLTDDLFFALHLIFSSYLDVVDARTRPSNVVNTRYSASPSNFP